MAFKIEVEEFDLDLELPLINGKEELVKCVKSMHTKNYTEFLDFCRNIFKNDTDVIEKARKDPASTVKGIVKQIDWLYEKGEDWWLTNVHPQIIMAVMERTKEFVTSFGKKKTGAELPPVTK